MSMQLPQSLREHLSRLASLGGQARAKKLTRARRKEIAEKASRAAKRARARRAKDSESGASDSESGARRRRA